MRDGVRLNTFVFLPQDGGPRFPVILHRTPYGITLPQGQDVTDCTKGWLPDPQTPLLGAILRGWREIVRHGYAAVYQDCRGRYGSEGEDHVYGDDAADGYDTLEWIASEPWTNHRVGLSGSSAASTTALAAASQRHPTVRAFFAQVGGSSIYDDVVYEGQSIEMERLWLWVAGNIAGLSASHREAVARQRGLNAAELAATADSARARYAALAAAGRANPPFIESAEWMHLPLTGYPDFSVWQPYLDEILRHPAPDEFRARHNFRATIDIPGFHVTTWFDIFQTSVLAAFTESFTLAWATSVYGLDLTVIASYTNATSGHAIRTLSGLITGSRASTHRLWTSRRSSIRRARGSRDEKNYVANDWRHSESWPPSGTVQQLDRLDPVLPLSPAAPSAMGLSITATVRSPSYAAFNAKSGKALGKTVARHTSAEFVAFLSDIVANQPRGKAIHLICDNLSAHKTHAVRDFLTAHPHLQIHYIPTYSSWLNQVELWFNRLQRDVLARGVFTSLADLKRKLMRYFRRYNKTPKPIKWVYRNPTRLTD